MNDQIQQDREAQKRQAEKDAERGGRDAKPAAAERTKPAQARREQPLSEGVDSSPRDDAARSAGEYPAEGK